MIRETKNDYWLVPDVNAIAREMTDSSQMRVVINRFLKLKSLSMLKLGLGNIRNGVELLRMDFSAGVMLLVELELLKLLEGKKGKKCLVLHSQMVDMALGLDNKKVFLNFFALCDRYGMIPGLASFNLRFLIKRLSNIRGLPKNLRVYSWLKEKDNSVLDYVKISLIDFYEMISENKKKEVSLVDIFLRYLDWSREKPVGKIPVGVAKEGAGENRIPFAYLANSVPVYVYVAKELMSLEREQVDVLDVGCGTGRSISFVAELVSRRRYKYFGIDYSKACIDYARTRYRQGGVTFVQHEGGVFPYPDACFDVVVSSHVLEHINKNKAPLYFAEIARVLKPGGVAVIGTPNKKYCQDLLMVNRKDKRRNRLILPHIHEYYYDELKKVLAKGGWFSEFLINQTINDINRRLMIESIKKIKPGKSFWTKLRFGLYSWVRQVVFVQDLMAKWGTELVLKKMGVGYEELVESARFLNDKGVDEEGDNLLIVARK